MALSLLCSQYAESAKDETKRRLPLRGITALGRYGAWPLRRCRHPSDNGGILSLGHGRHPLSAAQRQWATMAIPDAWLLGRCDETSCV